MKSVFLFTTRLRMYWVLLPIAALLSACIAYNTKEAGAFGLYPLIILLCGAILFIFIYFFRAVKISFDEIKSIGAFSGRDSAVITEGKTLILEHLRGGRLQITLFGNDGILPELDWMKSTGDAPRDIALYRGKVIWYRYSVNKILRYFGFNKEDILAIRSAECEKVHSNIATATLDKENGNINVKINKTV